MSSINANHASENPMLQRIRLGAEVMEENTVGCRMVRFASSLDHYNAVHSEKRMFYDLPVFMVPTLPVGVGSPSHVSEYIWCVNRLHIA